MSSDIYDEVTTALFGFGNHFVLIMWFISKEKWAMWKSNHLRPMYLNFIKFACNLTCSTFGDFMQPEPEFRPPMSEVVQALVRLMQRASLSKRNSEVGTSDAPESSLWEEQVCFIKLCITKTGAMSFANTIFLSPGWIIGSKVGTPTQLMFWKSSHIRLRFTPQKLIQITKAHGIIISSVQGLAAETDTSILTVQWMKNQRWMLLSWQHVCGKSKLARDDDLTRSSYYHIIVYFYIMFETMQFLELWFCLISILEFGFFLHSTQHRIVASFICTEITLVFRLFKISTISDVQISFIFKSTVP